MSALLIERQDPLKSLERFPLENREDDDVWRGTETERGSDDMVRDLRSHRSGMVGDEKK